jgi:Fic family protein
MRLPEKPPPTDELMREAVSDPQRLVGIMGKRVGPKVNGRYVHWDKLKYYTPPEGLSTREWWLAIKLARMSNYVNTPLTDRGGVPFRFGLVDPIPERLHEIDLGAGGLIQMPEEIATPETKDRYYVGSLIEEAITSSQLEGATTTRRVAKEMLRTGRQPKDRSERMILNNFGTMRRIGDLKDGPLTPEVVFEIHRLVTDRTLDDPDAAGRLRREDEPVVVSDIYGEVLHTPPAAGTLKGRLDAMCDFANGRTPDGFIAPPIRSILLHFWLSYDHPFVDGSGRTARALFYWSMLRHKYWLCEFISISHIILHAPAKYGRAFLYTESDETDLTYFILYHLEVIRRAVVELHEYISRKAQQRQVLERELRGISELNHRQRALISHALRHPNHEYTVESHRRSHNVVYETARTDLLELNERGLLTKVKVGKTWRFTPVPNLEEKLSHVP